ncbi:MAG: RDD family protein [Bacteroidia bacterium]
MKIIEISTSQNVTIKYELASPLMRFLAFMIDFIFLALLNVIIWAIVEGSFSVSYWQSYIWLPFTCYTLLLESLNKGATLGKLILGLRVMRIDGREIKFTDYMMRWLFRLLDIYASFGALAVFTSLSSHKYQRLGDFMANTVVVVLKKERRFKLDNLLKFDSLSDYEVMFPQVVNLSEEEMLLLKEVVGKYSAFRNEAHTLALESTASIIANRLRIDKPDNNASFLKRLIKDYVVLTR